MNEALQQTIEQAWENRDALGPETKGEVRQAVDAALAALDSGEARIARKAGDEWVVNQWLKKAVLLSFRLNPMEMISGAPAVRTGGTRWRRSLPAGARRNLLRLHSAPFRGRSCAAALMSEIGRAHV